jgi:hypothetical protein
MARKRSAVREASRESRCDSGAFAPAQHVGEIVHAVASALSEIPSADVDGIEVRRGKRRGPAGSQLVTLRCRVTNEFGTVAALLVEIEAHADLPVDSTDTTHCFATPEPELECIDNIPV